MLAVFSAWLRALSVPLISCYRSVFLRRVAFIGVTGSGGKTTTKELIAAALGAELPGSKSSANFNSTLKAITRTVLRAKRSDRFCVQELAAADRGKVVNLDRFLRILKPQVGVVINVAAEHLSAFGGLEAIAEHKSKVTRLLPEDGVAVLNADDPNVVATAARTKANVITFGLRDADVRARNVTSSWPDTLSFDLIVDGETRGVCTDMHGKHLVHNYLATFAVCRAMGINLERAIAAVEQVRPPDGRMNEVRRKDGVAFMRDDFKAPAWSFECALGFLADARASRKFAVVGRLSDYHGSAGPHYRNVAKSCLEVADEVIFVGTTAPMVRKIAVGTFAERLRIFVSPDDAVAYLNKELASGDFVLMKGPAFRRRQRERLFSADHASTRSLPRRACGIRTEGQAGGRPVGVICGLGNPGRSYADTPHNVGTMTVENIASALGASWTSNGSVRVAQATHHGIDLHLLQPLAMVNNSGPVLDDYLASRQIDPRALVIIQDDIDLPIGTVRARQSGTAGGHNGVRSMLTAIGTDEVRRVKVGVGRSDGSKLPADHVVSSFTKADLKALEPAISNASELALSGLHRLSEEGEHALSDTQRRYVSNWKELERQTTNEHWDGYFQSLVDRFSSDVLPKKKPGQRKIFEQRLGQLVETFGRMPLTAVHGTAIEEYVGRCVSKSDAHEVQLVFSALFKSALRWGWVRENPIGPSTKLQS